MSENLLLEAREDGVVTLTLNRPAMRNALNLPLLKAMETKIQTLRFDPGARVVILTGAGDKAFCSGADLKERAGLAPIQVEEFIFTLGRLLCAIEALPQPVIAAVNGVALGGGTELALAADMRLAAENVSMGLIETRLAVIPGGGGTQRLPRLIGVGKAKELIFTGRRIDAREALAIGLVNQVTPQEDLLPQCRKLADMILQSGPIAVAQAKHAINHGLETDLHTGLAIEANAYRVCIPTEDRLEGLAAFREKRPPVYRGR